MIFTHRKLFINLAVCILCIGVSAIFPLAAAADIKFFDLTNPSLRKMPLAIPVLKAMTPVEAERERTALVADEVSKMLNFTGYFKILERKSYLYDAHKSGITEKELNFGNWTVIGAEFLITGGVQVVGNKLTLDLLLFDPFKQKRLIGKRYHGQIADQNRILRRFCSEVMEAITGWPGMFGSRLAFVSTASGHKEIYTCDYDGTNIKQITKKKNITTFPSWSADGRYMAYTSFVNGPSQIFLREMKGGSETNLTFEGVQIEPAWHPKRFEISATMSMGEDQEIYMLTGGGKIIKKLTNSRGIDVSASWSPNGKQFAYVSNRSGSPQIYIMDVASGRTNRVTYEGKYNTQPSWAPKGDKIAYSSMEGGEIDIFVISVQGKKTIQLTRNSADNEAPSWSPDGSLIAFSSNREGRSRIYVMTAYGTDQRRLVTMDGDQTQPKWSPNFPH
ncbi:MAG: Tol-Pal system beta propeller repeat protein TolB [Desulfobacteraceae bacterium]|nr:Tol-Pal system beta propeller repeat protein TolB [Desulfobacteraceae bacterium]